MSGHGELGSRWVLLSPIGLDADCWQFLQLPDACAVEYPGHGRVPRMSGWTHARFADEVAASFEGPLDLVGISMGGAVAANLLARHPDRVRSAVIACSGFLTAPGSEWARAPADRRELYLARGRRALGAGGMRAVLDETLSRWFTAPALNVSHPGAEYAREALLRLNPEAWKDVWQAQADSERPPASLLAHVDRPVTLIGGTQDEASGLAGLSEMHGILPRSRFEVHHAPHMIHLEQPAAFAAALRRHFRWVVLGGCRVEPPIGCLVPVDGAVPEGERAAALYEGTAP